MVTKEMVKAEVDTLHPQDLAGVYRIIQAMRQRANRKSFLLSELADVLSKNQLEPLPPITSHLLGILQGSELQEQDYKTYLEEKYR
jgi:hypothetical protein